MRAVIDAAMVLFPMPKEITTRLRLALALIFLAVLVMGSLALLQAQRISQAYSQLHETALPLLHLSQSTRQTVDQFATMLSSVATQSIDDRIITSPQNVKEETEYVRESLEPLSKYDVAPSLLFSLDTRLAMTEATTLKILLDRTAFAEVRSKATDLQKKIISYRDTILNNINNLKSANQAQDVSPSLQAGLPKAMLSPDTDDTRHSTDALLVDQIGSLFDVLFARSFAINSIVENDHRIEEKADLEQYLLNIEQQISKVKDDEARQVLRQNASDFRNFLFGSDGFLKKHDRLIALRTAFEARRDFQVPLVEELSAMSSDLVTKSFSVVEGASRELNTAIRQLFWMQAGSLLLGIVTILLTNYFIVERQFSRRIQSLEGSVTAIARGELNHPITVSGGDEIGNVAAALSIFKENAQELRRSNVDLEKFAYVAAHDLRSPLKAIHDLSSWTLEDNENVLSPQSVEFQELLQARAKRLNTLLSDLLIYARLGKMRPDAQNVNLAQIVREQADTYSANANFKVRYSGLTNPIWIRLLPIEQTIANLISNAVKHHDLPAGQVTVTTHADDNHLTIEVEDDGPGIPKEYQDRVFDLFQTLRPRDEVEGSGLGLAIVKKLIETEHGTVTLFSDPKVKRGTVFKIILPLVRDAVLHIDHHIRPAA